MNHTPTPITVGKMDGSGQTCLRCPSGLVAVMESGSQPTRDADAASIAHKVNTWAGLLSSLCEVLDVFEPGAKASKAARDAAVREALAAILAARCN